MQFTVRPDLTVTLGREATRLSTAEGVEAAQSLIRAATRRLVQEEMGLVDIEAPSSPAGNRVAATLVMGVKPPSKLDIP
jgi:hypothetical protein